ncbi:hypothetical protein [Burkholderia territorii]|uniref:hypothetical protein n=1 Tax=Burkholderia territorii TaxID=1503055 RepID=UPI0012D8741F|nr:hypothetical protein [Burkholderia territorii]
MGSFGHLNSKLGHAGLDREPVRGHGAGRLIAAAGNRGAPSRRLGGGVHLLGNFAGIPSPSVAGRFIQQGSGDASAFVLAGAPLLTLRSARGALRGCVAV